MNRTEKMTGRCAVVLAMAVIVLSVTGTASAWCVVEREILVFCYTQFDDIYRWSCHKGPVEIAERVMT